MRLAAFVPRSRLFAAISGCILLSAGSVCAQDVANGLWQDYRYPASNPNWQRNYEREVATWGKFPERLRPRYNSSPDMTWGTAAPLGTSPFGDQPFYTVSRWQPYVPRPIDWSGLEYSGADAPPETSTGNHGWYGPNSPGVRGFTPAEWQQWEMNTPEGQRYREMSGIGGPPSRPPGARTRTASGVPSRERSALKQYFRSQPGKPGTGRWQERDGRIPPESIDRPTGDGQGASELKQYILNRPTAAARGRTPQLRVVRPNPAPDAKASGVVTPAPEHSGFTQYYLRTAPRSGQRRWEVKSKTPAPEQ